MERQLERCAGWTSIGTPWRRVCECRGGAGTASNTCGRSGRRRPSSSPARVAGRARGDGRGDGEHRRLLEADLLRARGGHHLPAGQRRAHQAGPGRKTDVQDCVWIAQLLEHGLLRGSFVPPAPIRELRDLTRYRKGLIQERQREANRLHKVLQDAGIKLASVATNILGVSGRAMLEAMVRAQPRPRSWRTWRAASCARSCRRCGRRWPGGSARTTPSWSVRGWRTWTTWTRRSTPSVRRSSA